MPKTGIKIIEETTGTGPELKKGDWVRLNYDIQLNQGDYLVRDQESEWVVGDRNFVAGFRYGIEGMRVEGHEDLRPVRICAIARLDVALSRRTPCCWCILSAWRLWLEVGGGAAVLC